MTIRKIGMGNITSAAASYDPAHVRIYNNLLRLKTPSMRVNMIEMLLSAPEYVTVSKRAGIYSTLISYVYAVKSGGEPPVLPGETVAVQQQPQQQGLFQTITKYTEKINPWKQVVKKPQEKALSYFNSCLEVLGISDKEPLTEELLKSAYKKASVKAHPDKKGGSDEMFQAVNRAHNYLSEIVKRVKTGGGSRPELTPTFLLAGQENKMPSVPQQQQQQPEEPAPIRLDPKNLNIDAFNRMFEQTKIKDANDDGYSSWLKSSEPVAAIPAHTYTGDFNADRFNAAFASQEQSMGGSSGGYDSVFNPSSMGLNLAPDMGSELGHEGISDFTAPANADIQYTDLKRAYTSDATFTNKVANVKVESRTLEGYKAQREQGPAPLSQQESARMMQEEERKKMLEEQRQRRLVAEKSMENDYFERMKRLVRTE
jgi:curved DNA-binding protein CbpA